MKDSNRPAEAAFAILMLWALFIFSGVVVFVMRKL
jgi:hypothetical protein